MWEQWMPTLRLGMTREEFQQLPRNPSFTYDFVDGEVYIRPFPLIYHGCLDLQNYHSPKDLHIRNGISIQPLENAKILGLSNLFDECFKTVQPFAGMSERQRQEAVRYCLDRTQSGKDGLCLDDSCFCAKDQEQRIVAAIIITQLERIDELSILNANKMNEQKNYEPHLTWIFVHPAYGRSGVGTALLRQSASVLGSQNYHRLYSSFLPGNLTSILWHWRNGFQLLSGPGSLRGLSGRGSS